MVIHTKDTSLMKRHVGHYNDKRCAIVLQLPENPELVHIIDTDALPEIYHQNLMDIIGSPEGQAEKWLGNILNRRMLGDGTRALTTFYSKGFIQEVPVDKVLLTPFPNRHIPLKDVLALDQVQNVPEPRVDTSPNIDPELAKYNDMIAKEQEKLNKLMNPVDDVYNQHTQNLQGDINEGNRRMAQNLITEAEMLEAEASLKRTQASNMLAGSQNFIEKFVDNVTGKQYKSSSALKGAITRREKLEIQSK